MVDQTEFDTPDRYGVTLRQRAWCNEILILLGRSPPVVQIDFHELLVKHLKRKGVKTLSAGSIHNYTHKVPLSPTAPHIVEFIQNELSSYISRTPHLEKHLREEIRQRLADQGVGTTPVISRAAALTTLLEAEPSQFGSPVQILGEYFGYRRSAFEGEIIRFYIWIKPTAEKNIVSFVNHFIRGGQERWTTKGFGFAVDGINYLVGHAVANPGNRGLGLRCFALVPYPPLFGWLTGPLLSVHYREKLPISARVVLIPEHYHPGLLPKVKVREYEDISSAIKKSVTADLIDQQVDQRDGKGNSVFNDKRKCSDYVRFLIRNWTLTTLKAGQEYLPDGQDWISALRRIWEIEQDLATLYQSSETVDGRYLSALEAVTRDLRAE